MGVGIRGIIEASAGVSSCHAFSMVATNEVGRHTREQKLTQGHIDGQTRGCVARHGT